ncbi:MAG: Zn-dependent hydrolase [Gemmatimonadota bacterium]|nr:Zn-dependent hydrolase [Gemmatimonadota bacterium]
MRLVPVLIPLLVLACQAEPSVESGSGIPMADYAEVSLTTDLDSLSANERAMIPLLIEAADAMDEVFWRQTWGNRDSLLASIADPQLVTYARINYGPWDRLSSNTPFLDNVGPKAAGSGFYPADMTKEEFEAAVAGGGTRADSLKSLYTLVRRSSDGGLRAIPYHVAFAEPVTRAAGKLREAAALADDPGLRRYLELRAAALLNDDYRASDMAWMDMKDNGLDVVIGPIETYEDQLFGYKASHEAYILVKDRAWSGRLARYAALLPALQRGLPVADRYRQETPGSDSQLNAYDAIYYAGEANAGSKTIAINLPNDETVQLAKGTRRLQLKNSMRAKFDLITEPLAAALLAEDQLADVTFDAFFANTMFHEVAHGLGIKNTITGTGTVREAMQDQASALEEGKADVLGLYMITALHAQGEVGDARLETYYTTFVAGMLRSIRFGAASAHGRANVARFNFFAELGAFSRDSTSGRYRVDHGRLRLAMDSLSATILRLQGDGDYEAARQFTARYGTVGDQLRQDLDRLSGLGIPVDIVFRQGMSVLQP